VIIYLIREILNKGFHNFLLQYSHINCGQNVLDTAVNFKYLCIKFDKNFYHINVIFYFLWPDSGINSVS